MKQDGCKYGVSCQLCFPIAKYTLLLHKGFAVWSRILNKAQGVFPSVFPFAFTTYRAYYRNMPVYAHLGR